MNVAPANDARDLMAVVERCRRRVGIRLFLRWSARVWVAAAGTATALAYLGWPNVPSLPWTVLLALTTGALVAGWQYPSAAEVARRIDRSLRLDDSFGAALQMHGSSSPVAPLVIRHGRTRARGVEPRRVFPLDAGKSALVAAATAVVLIALGQSGPAPARTGDAIYGTSTSTVTGAPGDSSRATQRQSGEEARTGGTAPQPSADAPEPARDLSARGAANDPHRLPAATTSASSQPSQADASGSRTGGADQIAEASGPGFSNSASAGAPSKGDGGEGSRAAAVGTNASGSGSGANVVGDGRGDGDGGVRGGSLLASSRSAEASRRTRPAYAAEYVRARRAIEAAIQRDRVPPDIQPYVREYFRVIAPGEPSPGEPARRLEGPERGAERE